MQTPASPPSAGLVEQDAAGSAAAAARAPGETAARRLDATARLVLLSLLAAVPLVYAPFCSDYAVPKVAIVLFVAPLLLGLLLVRAALSGSPLPGSLRPLYLSLAGLAVATLLAWVAAGADGHSGEASLVSLSLVVLCPAAAWSACDRRLAARVCWTVAATGSLVAVLGILQRAGVRLIPTPERYGGAPISTLGNANFVAHYQGLVLPVAIGLVLAARRRLARLAAAGLAATCAAHLILSRSAGGVVAAMVAGAVLLATLGPRLRTARRLWLAAAVVPLLAAVVAALLLVAPAAGPGGAGDAGAKSGSAWWRPGLWPSSTAAAAALSRGLVRSARGLTWLDALAAFARAPWLGAGPGRFGLSVPAGRDAERQRQWRALMGERDEIPYHAHNEYLEAAVETGILGLAALIGVLAVLLHLGRQAVAGHARGSADRTLAASMLAALASALTHALVSFNLHDPAAAVHFWTYGGLLAGLARRAPHRASIDLEVTDVQPAEAAGRRVARGARLMVVLAAALVVASGGAVAAVRMLVADYQYFAGLQAERLGQPAEAALAFGRAAAWRPHDFRYHHLRALVELRRQELGAARAAVRRSLDLHPNNRAALHLAGEVYRQSGLLDSAVWVLEAALRLDGTRPETYELLATVHRQAGRHREAVAAWQRALELRPGRVALLNSLAVEYALAGEVSRAKELLESGLAQAPDHAEIMGNLGSVCLSAGEIARGEQLLLQALQLEPEQVSWRLHLATHYARTGQWEAAARHVAAILACQPQDEAARRLQAQIRAQLGRER